MLISIIVVSWNTRDILRDCLVSVFSETQGVSYEVIVVDNASGDDTVAMLESEFPQVIRIENKENRGFAAANNQALEIACGRLILLLNSDTIVLDGAIQKVAAYMDREEDVGVVGCHVLSPDGSDQNTCFRFPTLWLLTVNALAFFREAALLKRLGWAKDRSFLYPDRYPYMDYARTYDVETVAGCFLMTRRNVVDQVGGLDEEFFMYGEEAEWCHRIRAAGWKVRYFPGARIIHLFGASASQVAEETVIAKRRAQVLLMLKARGPAAAWVANAVMLIGVLLRTPFWFVSDFAKGSDGKSLAGRWAKRLGVVGFHLLGLCGPTRQLGFSR